MPVTPLDRIITTATLRLVGALSSTIKYELFSVADEFLQGSGAWLDDVTFTTKDTSQDYYVSVVAGQIIRLQGVRNPEGFGVSATMPIPGCIKLDAPPPDDQVFKARVVLSVADPVTRDAYPIIPQWMAIKYNGVLLDGVLGQMMSQPSRPYSNESMGVYHLRRFRNGIAGARADALRANTTNAHTWAYPQAFAVKRRYR